MSLIEPIIPEANIDLFIKQNVPEKKPFTRKVFFNYIKTFLNTGDIKDLLLYAQSIYDPLSDVVTDFVKFDPRAKSLSLSGIKNILSAAVQFQDLGFFRFLYFSFFADVEFEYKRATESPSYLPIACTDLLPVNYTDTDSLITDYYEILYLQAFVRTTPANLADNKTNFSADFQLLLSITKPARMFVSTTFLVMLETEQTLTSYGTVVTDHFTGASWASVSSWIASVTTMTITDWNYQTHELPVTVDTSSITGFNVYQFSVYWAGVKSLSLNRTVLGVPSVAYKFLFSSDLYIKSDYYRGESSWKIQAKFSL